MYCTVDKSHTSGAPATHTKNVKDGEYSIPALIISTNNYLSRQILRTETVPDTVPDIPGEKPRQGPTVVR